MSSVWGFVPKPFVTHHNDGAFSSDARVWCCRKAKAAVWAQNGPECTVSRFSEDRSGCFTEGGKLRFCASFYALKGFDANNLKLGRKDQRGLYSHLSADETVYFKSRHKSAFCLATRNKSWVSNNKWEQMANQSPRKVWSQTKPKFTDYKPSMKCHLRWDTMVLAKSYSQSHPVAAHGTAAKHSTSIKMSLKQDTSNCKPTLFRMILNTF